MMNTMCQPTFLARCAGCGSSFSRPEISDFGYGMMLFSTSDGRHHKKASAFGEFQRRVGRLTTVGDFRDALARLADPIAGQKLVAVRPCPHCGSTELKSWCGVETGTTVCEEVTFFQASLLNEDELASRISGKLTW